MYGPSEQVARAHVDGNPAPRCHLHVHVAHPVACYRLSAAATAAAAAAPSPAEPLSTPATEDDLDTTVEAVVENMESLTVAPETETETETSEAAASDAPTATLSDSPLCTQLSGDLSGSADRSPLAEVNA